MRFQCESVLEEDLLRYIAKGALNKESKDYVVWGGDSLGAFSVKSTYASMYTQVSGASNDIFKILWQANAMPKAQITAWRILLDRVPTRINLIRRGVSVNSSVCTLCQASEEMTQHLFLDYTFAQRVWTLC